MTVGERYQPGRRVPLQINSIGPCSNLNDRRLTSRWWCLFRSRSDTPLDGGGTMPTCEDYKQMAGRVAQLAIATSAPTLSQALMALAVDHMTRAARLSELQDSQQRQRPMQQEQSAGYGD